MTDIAEVSNSNPDVFWSVVAPNSDLAVVSTQAGADSDQTTIQSIDIQNTPVIRDGGSLTLRTNPRNVRLAAQKDAPWVYALDTSEHVVHVLDPRCPR